MAKRGGAAERLDAAARAGLVALADKGVTVFVCDERIGYFSAAGEQDFQSGRFVIGNEALMPIRWALSRTGVSRNYCEKGRVIRAMKRLAPSRERAAVSRAFVEGMVGWQNGTLDLRAGRLLPFAEETACRYNIPHAFPDDGPSKPHALEVAALLERLFGTPGAAQLVFLLRDCLLCRAGVGCIVLPGGGCSGKSTITQLMLSAFGRDGVCRQVVKHLTTRSKSMQDGMAGTRFLTKVYTSHKVIAKIDRDASYFSSVGTTPFLCTDDAEILDRRWVPLNSAVFRLNGQLGKEDRHLMDIARSAAHGAAFAQMVCTGSLSGQSS